MRALCWGCGQPVQVRPCRGGDGSAVRIVSHKAAPDHAVSCRGAYTVLDAADVLDEPITRPGRQSGGDPS